MHHIRSNYQTKQKQFLEDFFKQHPGHHFTISELKEKFNQQAISIGTTTLYRQVDQLVQHGVINQYAFQKGEACYYEYNPSNENPHLHFRCASCGEFFHLPWIPFQEIQQSIEEKNAIQLDLAKTIFVGECQQCKEERKTNEKI